MDFSNELTTFGEFVKGTCELMCPTSERIMRERERLVHPLERQTDPHSLDLGKECQSKTKRIPKRGYHDQHKADPAKTVKAFSRSAAGMKMPSPSDLRPFPVLESTVSYLIEKIACVGFDTSGWIDRYNFVTDRLRAVRQDMVIQGLPPTECIKLLQPMVKFHVFGAYWLCENPIQLFDPKTNASFLQECIKRLLVMYDAIRIINRKTVSRGSSQDAEVSIEKRTTCNCPEHLMEALYLIINLGDYQALSRSLTRLEVFNECQSCVERTAFQLSLATWKGEYVRVCRLIRKLNPLLFMAAALHLPSIRRSALLVMATAYNSKSLKFPLDLLCETLLWNDSAHASSECQYYGLKVEKSSDMNCFVGFEKASFNANIRSIGPTRLHLVDRNLSSKAVADMLK